MADQFLTWFFGFTTVIGTILTIYFGRKTVILERTRKKLDWPDLQASASDLGNRIKRDFKPDAILTPGLRGATVSKLLKGELGYSVPTFVGMSLWKQDMASPLELSNYELIETEKWYVYIPSEVFSDVGKRVLIVDDFAMSGDFIQRVRHLLRSKGLKDEQIRTACVACTKVAIRNHKAPDYYWIEVESDDFFFPWGKAK